MGSANRNHRRSLVILGLCVDLSRFDVMKHIDVCDRLCLLLRCFMVSYGSMIMRGVVIGSTANCGHNMDANII